MEFAVADFLEEEEKKHEERKRLKQESEAAKARKADEDFIKLPSNGGSNDAFEAKYRSDDPAPPPSSRRDLFGGRVGSANRYLKYEDENDSSNQRSPPKHETPDRASHNSRDDTRGASDAESANGSVRSSRRRSRSPSTGRHSRRDRDHYRSRPNDRYRNSPRHSQRGEDDRHRRSRRDTEEYDRNDRSSYKRRASDDVDMTDAPPPSRGRHDRSPRGDRPGSSHTSDRYRRDDRRRDDRYHGSRRDDYRRDEPRHHDSRRDDRREHHRKKTPEPTDDERDLRTVFVQQLAARLRTKELKEFFEKLAGAVQDAQIVKDRVSGRSKGVGYVEFKDKESIQKALGLTGHKLAGIPIIVTVSDAEKNRQAKASEGVTNANNNGQPYHRLYVGNIQFSITEEDITSLFESFGPLDFVQLQRDELGRSKGYGFVQFTDPKDAQAALESMNGQMLNNRPMRVGLGTTDKLAQEANASLQQRQAAQSGSAFSGAGGRGGYSNNSKEDANKGAGASALDDNDVNGVSLSNVNRHELMRKLARLDDGTEKKADEKPKSSKPAIQKVDPTRCVCLANLWSAKTTATPGWMKEIEDDVRTECNEKYGIVKHVGIDPNSQQGEVYVKFDRVQGGENAYRGLNGRYFDEARINARYIVDAVYNVLFPKASNL